MSQADSLSPDAPVTHTIFEDRRVQFPSGVAPGMERRQFHNSYDGLSANAQELALAIDKYKVQHRRRFITFEEMMKVIESLGYHK